MTVLETEALLLVPPSTTTTLDISRSPSPVANRQLSRSPHPYRRRRRQQEPRRPPLPDQSDCPPPALTLSSSSSSSPSSPDSSKPGSPKKSSYSESGTEADDELTRRLPAPPALRRISSEDEAWNRYDGGARSSRGRQSSTTSGAPKTGRPRKRAGIAFVRRVIEVALSLVLVVVALSGQGRRPWREVLLRRKGRFGSSSSTPTLCTRVVHARKF